MALTIRYMATGNSQVSLSFSFPVGKSTVSGILKETCEDLWQNSSSSICVSCVAKIFKMASSTSSTFPHFLFFAGGDVLRDDLDIIPACSLGFQDSSFELSKVSPI